MKHDFSLAKKRVGIYFNDGTMRYSVQVSPDKPAEAKLVEAIRAAFRTFYVEWNGKKERR